MLLILNDGAACFLICWIILIIVLLFTSLSIQSSLNEYSASAPTPTTTTNTAPPPTAIAVAPTSAPTKCASTNSKLPRHHIQQHLDARIDLTLLRTWDVM